MRVLIASSEMVPFAKTGGLADVCGALPIELAKRGDEVVVFLPAYPGIHEANIPIEETEIEFQIPIGSKMVSGQLLKATLPKSNVTIYFVHQPDYFYRDGLYQFAGEDFKDNCERFVFFNRFLLESLSQLNWYPDVIHCNDWQTSLIPAYLKTTHSGQSSFKEIATLLTIHNLAYQGNFWHWDMLLTGIDWQYFNWRQMEFYGRLNLLKTGIVFADAISTVSPRYALEIQTPEQGCGLESVLLERSESLTGILNGIDTQVWNPRTDEHLACNYDVNDWQTGKAKCKADLQSILNLPAEPTQPVIGIVGRLAAQKGWSLILEVMRHWLQHNAQVQWAILGTGDPTYQQTLQQLQKQWPDSVGLKLAFSDKLAHQIEAGADIFLMPSQYEPCGLNQLYSMQYGTVPVVHETGGLADTVVDCTQQNLADQTANGFLFKHYHTRALEEALSRAVHTFTHQATWNQLVENGMGRDWSWTSSANQYRQLYRSIAKTENTTQESAKS